MKHKQRSLKFLWIVALCFVFQNMAGVAHAIDPNEIDQFVQRADRGDVQAEYVLGMSFLKGDGIVQNDFLAKQYLTLAAAQGNQEAQIQLDQRRHPQQPIIQLKPKFDQTLPLLPKSSQNIEQTRHFMPTGSHNGNRRESMLKILELVFTGLCFLLSFQGFRWLYRFLFPKKQKQAKLGAPATSYKIITDFKGRL